MLEIAFPISCGFSERELALRLDTTAAWVRERLAELAEELEAATSG